MVVVAVVVGQVQGAEGTPPGVVLVNLLLGKALKRKAPTIPPAKKPKILIRAVAEVVAVAAAEVIGMVTEVIEAVTVAEAVNTIVAAGQAGPTRKRRSTNHGVVMKVKRSLRRRLLPPTMLLLKKPPLQIIGGLRAAAMTGTVEAEVEAVMEVEELTGPEAVVAILPGVLRVVVLTGPPPPPLPPPTPKNLPSPSGLTAVPGIAKKKNQTTR